jgi:outer membrane cobalamin receptor
MKLRFVAFLFVIPVALPPLIAGDLSFLVVDSMESPVAGALVEVRATSQTLPVFACYSDRHGRASVSLSFPVTVRVQAIGFEPLSKKIAADPHGEIVLRLVPSVFSMSVEVLVKDNSDVDEPLEQSALVIERSGARTVYDAIDKLIPSAYVPSRSVLGHGLGISNSIALRGMGGSPTTQLLVVVDGRPDVMGLMGHPIPDFYTLTDVGSLSITAGPASVLYGNRAMSGVIEIEPTRPKPGFHTELTASLGSYYTGQYRFLHSGRLKRFQYQLAGGIEHTNGHRENSSFRNQDVSTRLGYDLTPVWKASIDGRYGHFNFEDPGTVQAPMAGQWYRVERGGYNIGLDNRTENAWGTIHFFSSHGHHMLYDGFRSVDSNTGFRVQETFTLGSGVETNVGIDIARYGGRARNISSGLNFGEHHVSEGGGFARARWNAASRLRLNGGFRYDHNSVFGGVVAAEFGASYRFATDAVLSLAVAKGFRNPTIRELYLFPAPTPTLEPERLWNYQMSFQFRPVSRLLAWMTGYYSDASNLIVTTGRFPNLKLENIGRAINRGLEVNARYHLMRGVNLSVGYAHLRSTNLAPYVPENKLIYSLDVNWGRAFVSFGGSTIGRTWADAVRTLRLSGYTVARLKCTFLMARHWSVFATVDNLFNQGYQEIAGYPMPGINAAGGFKLTF